MNEYQGHVTIQGPTALYGSVWCYWTTKNEGGPEVEIHYNTGRGYPADEWTMRAGELDFGYGECSSLIDERFTPEQLLMFAHDLPLIVAELTERAGT